MECSCRIHVYRSTKDFSIQGSRRDAYLDTALRVPTGQCMACRIRLTREWSVRAMHEATGHDFNLFATLTYSDEELPFGNNLVKKHLQDFHKRLRKKRPKIRLLACGEYGDDTDRPHYHGLYFGLKFEDKELLKMVDGKPLYRSDQLDELWGYGHCNFYDEITPQAAGYVAGYTKKKTGKNKQEAYQWICEETGEIVDRIPEFKSQSLKPGIGANFCIKWLKDIYSKDQIIHDGKALIPPRYYDKLCEIHAPELWRKVQIRRKKKAHQKEVAARKLANEDKSVVPFKGSDRHGYNSDRILKSKKIPRNKQ